MHRQRYEKEAREEVSVLRERYGYDAIDWLDADAMASALGSTAYFGGTRDTGTGHIHPMKAVIGLARAAAKAGAVLHENSAMEAVRKDGGLWAVKTAHGTIRAEKVLLALNGYHADIDGEISRHVMPIQSFIGATEPLGHNSPVLPGREAVDDSRFVVRYFRKSADNRLLFGGREAYGKATPGDIERAIRRQITQIYPDLAEVPITHAWGGNCRHHHAAHALRARVEAGALDGRRLLRPWCHHGPPYRAHGCRELARYQRSDTPVARLEDSRLPRRRDVPQPAQGAGANVVCDARSPLMRPYRPVFTLLISPPAQAMTFGFITRNQRGGMLANRNDPG